MYITNLNLWFLTITFNTKIYVTFKYLQKPFLNNIYLLYYLFTVTTPTLSLKQNLSLKTLLGQRL